MGVLLSLLIFSHILADFLFQTEEIALRKGKSWYALTLHVGVWFVTATVFTLFFAGRQLLWIIAVLGAVHFIVDKAKALIETRCPNWQAELLLVDQTIHLGAILLAYPWLKAVTINGEILAWLQTHPPFSIYYPDLAALPQATVAYAVLVAGALLFNYRGANFLIAKAVQRFIPAGQTAAAHVSPAASAKIGRLERLIVLTFVLLGAYTAIAMIFAAKSVVRLKELETPDFANYYIIGTLASTMCALFSGLAVRMAYQLMLR